MSKYFKVFFNLVALSITIFIGVDVFYKILFAKIGNIERDSTEILFKSDLKHNKRFPVSYYRNITDRNIFKSTDTGDKAKEKQKIIDVKTLEHTSLKISLVGTVVGDRKNTFAVIKEKNKKKQELYREGDTIQGALIKDIFRGKIVLRVGDRDEILTIEEDRKSRTEKKASKHRPSVAAEKDGTVVLSKSDVEDSFKNVHELLSQVRVRPHFRDGRPDGLAISSIKAGSFFAKLGLRNGDVVQGVDGRSIKSPDDVLDIYTKLKSASQVELQIRRRGKSKKINYEFR
ncbi:MAG: type II secretion system protein GspC [Thermodesulfobacteriota bacterium]|nr:type II secretion system protein GspC [Thermodesulfobacteriota bacterium]